MRFCRVKKHPFDHLLKNSDGIVVCKELLAYKCPYCKEQGHTTKHCPKLGKKKQNEVEYAEREAERRLRWEQNREVREQEKKVREEKEIKEKEQLATFKSNCWAAIAAKGVSSSVLQQIEEEERGLKEKQAALKAKRLEEERVKKQQKQEEWERTYPLRMDKKYGQYWPFYTEGTLDDSEIARQLRSEKSNQERFNDSLFAKYGRNWYNRCMDTADDCFHVERQRWLIKCMEDARYWDNVEEWKNL